MTNLERARKIEKEAREMIRMEGLFSESFGGTCTIRGYARYDEIVELSYPHPGYQRPVDDVHVGEISMFITSGSNSFSPEVVLAYTAKYDYYKEGAVSGIDAIADIRNGNGFTSNIDGISFKKIRKVNNGYLYEISIPYEKKLIVDAILRAKGFTTYVSPAGPDKGVDILASAGTLGFGSPKICVQVKSTDAPVDRIVLDQLGGVMKNFGAEYGLLVSWSGFKSSVINETAKQFFEIRLWTHKEIIEEFLRYYDQMDDEIKELIPLKKIWVVSNDDQ